MGERTEDTGGRRLSSARSGERRRAVIVGGAVLLAAAFGSAALFLPVGSGQRARAYALAPESALPANLRQAPPNVREAYRFALANLETLRHIPCYCGCGKDGHKNNADCYVKEVKADGSIVFDPMSFG